ncbi:MAG: PD-(D/E)XK nuclease family protein [Chthoniobacterales bacterium]|nr:PD-(D/E)XK nuclease family protein [Chthoniobacterales bacterium]
MNLLITGFDGSHWPHWFSLRAAVQSTKNATVVLHYPTADFSSADASWIGSWEEALGEAIPVSTSSTNDATDLLFGADAMRELQRSARRCTFLVGRDTAQEAEAVALQCLRFAADEKATRVGIIFPRGGALARLVAGALTRLEIPHNDGIAHSAPGLFECAEWRAWLQLQQGARINSLLRFLRAFPDPQLVLSDISLREFDRTLRSAYREVLLDDLTVLRQFCAQEIGGKGPSAAEALGRVQLLPAQATLPDFLAATQAAFASLEWKQHWMELTRRLNEWTAQFSAEFPRTLYLRWLREIASTATTARDPAGDHPYAPIQLLTVPQAHGQEWSHLIFAGWNEGAWPPPESGEFARDDEIALFNREILGLNRRARQKGSHGEGHISVDDDHALYLGPSEQRAIALRQFETLASSATEAIALSASLVQEDAPERFWNPSELFTRLFQQTHQRQPLTQAALKSLQIATAKWLRDAGSLTTKKELPSLTVEQTRVAYDHRRDAEKPAGEYDFAFRSSSPHIPIFSVTDIERLVKAPAVIWLKKYLGVEAADESGNPWSAATGQWVHHWLGSVSGAEGNQTFVRVPGDAEIEERICLAADQKLRQVERLCRAAGKPLPDWWSSGWQNALCLARVLGSKIEALAEWSWMSSEWRIEPDEAGGSPEASTLLLRGRVDLLLARGDAYPDSVRARDVWIVDYKTGWNKPLVPSREDAEKRKPRLHNQLVQGEALQLGLYALAARQRGANEVFMSLVSPAVKTATPQLSIGDIAAHGEVFEELARMQRSGVFGMYGILRPSFGYAPDYPLATLAVDPDLLDAKWELTHPALVREEEEWEL